MRHNETANPESGEADLFYLRLIAALLFSFGAGSVLMSLLLL